MSSVRDLILSTMAAKDAEKAARKQEKERQEYLRLLAEERAREAIIHDLEYRLHVLRQPPMENADILSFGQRIRPGMKFIVRFHPDGILGATMLVSMLGQLGEPLAPRHAHHAYDMILSAQAGKWIKPESRVLRIKATRFWFASQKKFFLDEVAESLDFIAHG